VTDTTSAAIVGGLAGVITGAISSIIAPWANWGIEKQRLLRETRKDIIQNARRTVVSYRQCVETSLGDRLLGYALNQNTAWLRIKPFLHEDVWKLIDEAARVQIRDGRALLALAHFEQDINRLEKLWKLT